MRLPSTFYFSATFNKKEEKLMPIVRHRWRTFCGRKVQDDGNAARPQRRGPLVLPGGHRHQRETSTIGGGGARRGDSLNVKAESFTRLESRESRGSTI